MPKLSLFRRPSASVDSDAVDEGPKAGIALVGQMRELAQALRAAVGQILAQLRQARQSIPSVLSDESTESSSTEA
jgi:hypothetical protein